jgi:Family of unknown function (DUF5677)
MFGLQELFDKQIEEQFQPIKLGVCILENGLENIGIYITDLQRADLENQFSKTDLGALSFNFSDEQIQATGFSSEAELESNVREVVEGLPSNIEKFLGNVDETIKCLVVEVTDSIAESILQALDERMVEMIDDQNEFHNGFAKNIQSIWGVPLGLLQGLIVIADESAQYFSSRKDECLEVSLVQDLLVRIHAKSVQVAKEIFTLLRNGFSDGAQARWRTLHELAVISAFISEHGEEVAKRYISHEAVDTYKAAVQYNEYYPRLGAEPISEEDLEIMRKDYETLLVQYGQNFKHDYGWAAGALALNRPTFRDIEVSIELDHLRPYYKAASANIHGNPAGVFQSLGLFPEEDIILSGPSTIGLTRPAQFTATSLNIITTTMLVHGANVDSIVISKAIAKYGRKVEYAFNAIEEEMSLSDGI